ncbi:MAG: hypothetical protein M0008_06890 [Actinomycetota bacterium]|nr:hypothetical protein [Actinomycetota bacterium]
MNEREGKASVAVAKGCNPNYEVAFVHPQSLQISFLGRKILVPQVLPLAGAGKPLAVWPYGALAVLPHMWNEQSIIIVAPNALEAGGNLFTIRYHRAVKSMASRMVSAATATSDSYGMYDL